MAQPLQHQSDWQRGYDEGRADGYRHGFAQARALAAKVCEDLAAAWLGDWHKAARLCKLDVNRIEPPAE